MLVLQMSLMPNADTEPISCGTARSLFDLRFSHQLSSEYTILGDLPLHANIPSASQPLNPGPLTRVMTWNVGGGKRIPMLLQVLILSWLDCEYSTFPVYILLASCPLIYRGTYQAQTFI